MSSTYRVCDGKITAVAALRGCAAPSSAACEHARSPCPHVRRRVRFPHHRVSSRTCHTRPALDRSCALKGDYWSGSGHRRPYATTGMPNAHAACINVLSGCDIAVTTNNDTRGVAHFTQRGTAGASPLWHLPCTVSPVAPQDRSHHRGTGGSRPHAADTGRDGRHGRFPDAAARATAAPRSGRTASSGRPS